MTGSHYSWRRMCATLGLALCLLQASAVAKADDPKPGTNLDVMTALGEQVAGDVVLQLGDRLNKSGVRVRGFAVNEHYQFMNGIFRAVLTEKGYRVYPANAELPDGSTIEYELLNFHLSYPEIYRSWLIGGKKVKRRAEIKMTMTLVNPDGSVDWVGETMKTFEDEFNHGDLSQMEEGAYSFSKPVQPESGWGKYVEPVFVTGIVVGLVYLFFSNQNNEN